MTRGRAKNWSQYNRSLVQQGSITFWLEKAAAETWFADEKGGIGRPKLYADCAIVALMVIKVVFKCGFRQLEGLMRDISRLMALGVTCPSYSQICRRAQRVRIPLRAYRRGPLHVIIDSSGLKIYGAGEWQMRKFKWCRRRGWKKVHLGICSDTQQVVAFSLMDKSVADSAEMPPLLDNVQGEVEEVICDGAYDARGCYDAIFKRGARATIPPRKGARRSGSIEYLQDRDRAIHRIRDQKRGLKRWKQEVGYHRRSLVETSMHRLKALGAGRLRSRMLSTQMVELSSQIFVLNETMALRS